jgi:hypothetical protein
MEADAGLQLLWMQLQILSDADADDFNGGFMAETALHQLRGLLAKGMYADVLLLVQHQRLGQLLGYAVGNAFSHLFQQLDQPELPQIFNSLQSSVQQLVAFAALLFASCNQWGGPDVSVSSVLLARQVAESGKLPLQDQAMSVLWNGLTYCV